MKIKKSFEKNLRARFDETNAVREGEYYTIKTPCKLCKTYYLEGVVCSRKCPFSCFEIPSEIAEGCVVFIRNITETKNGTLPIVMKSSMVMWYASEDKEARDFLKLIREEAKKVIRFV
ncbi:hypothetical protein HYT26_00855 [Candidatus Pacearchaeota archaeon]|nr:hypothetical protein [Candidatus Pacearchaeota archaeon]